MKKGLKNVIFFGMIFLILDQAVKIFINSRFVLGEAYILINNLLSILLVHNTGAAFSILSGNQVFLVIIGIIALVALLLFVYQGDNYSDYEIFAYSLLFGGILGNLIDRIFYGYVIDFISLTFVGYNFPIFNIADMCIVASVILIIIKVIKGDLWRE